MQTSSPTTVATIGLGQIGRAVTARALASEALELVAVADEHPDLAGQALGKLLEREPATELVVAPDIKSIWVAEPSVVLLCTGSRLEALLPTLRSCLERGVSVISSAEELACPRRTHPKLAKELDDLARMQGARLLGTGVNPGFVMDALPVFMAQAASNVERILVRRVVDSNSRRAALRHKTGCGLSLTEFEAGVAAGSIGHLGLSASAHLIASGLGVEANVGESIEPVVVQEPLTTPEGEVAIGHACGIHQVASARAAGAPEIVLDLMIAADADDPCDTIELTASPPIKLTLENGLEGDGATAARVVNAVGSLLAAPPGLHSVLDLRRY